MAPEQAQRVRVEGRHLLLDLRGCEQGLLAQSEQLDRLFCAAVRKGGATVVSSHFHQFEPHGVSGVVVLAESHVTVHTWPEAGYAAVDVFTCGSGFDPGAIADAILEALKPADSTRRHLTRSSE
ncbi:MAG: adenosylmethionine decarboxylase [Planctomycetes bacterium]|nr:adenosylmethionine decarboxylase [Planctomycetota bacterium]MCB9935102.1 adenosylmethionine decarboxylase [Planctomycetota bacterium]